MPYGVTHIDTTSAKNALFMTGHKIRTYHTYGREIHTDIFSLAVILETAEIVP